MKRFAKQFERAYEKVRKKMKKVGDRRGLKKRELLRRELTKIELD